MKMSLKVIERSDVTSVKILTHFFQEVNGLVFKFIRKCKDQEQPSILMKRRQPRGLYAIKHHDITINIKNITET